MIIRPGNESDFDFIINSFLKTGKVASIYRHVPSDIYFAEMEPIFKRELVLCDQLVAVHPENENHILGVIVFCGDQLVWAYTKAIYRRLGIFTELMKNISPISTYKYKIYTKQWREIEKKLSLKFNPFREVLP